MLKHATINRPTQDLRRLYNAPSPHEQQNQNSNNSVVTSETTNCNNSNTSNVGSSQLSYQHQLALLQLQVKRRSSSASSLPFARSITSTRLPLIPSLSSTASTLTRTTSDASSSHLIPKSNSNNNSKGNNKSTTIKIYAQSLSQEVEYITLNVNSQTKCSKVIRSLLRKFRLRHRDPNLFYLTLERWIRKDGLRHKSVMMLSDDACPVQLQQCCSNPPHNDIKFTLQVRPGVLIKVYCFDVAPDTKYKCLSLSPQTTVEETIELALHCLNLVSGSTQQPPAANSPHSTCSSSTVSSDAASSSASSTSSSSGLGSDRCSFNADIADSASRTSSRASVSSASSESQVSHSLTDSFLLLAECKSIAFERSLEAGEFLVDVYHSLHAQVQQQQQTSATKSNEEAVSDSSNNNNAATTNSESEFRLRLVKRDVPDFESVQPSPPPPTFVQNRLQVLPETQHLSLFDAERLASARQRILASMAKIELGYNGNSGGTLSHEKKLPVVPPRRRLLPPTMSTFGKPATMNARRHYDPMQLEQDLEQLNVERICDQTKKN